MTPSESGQIKLRRNLSVWEPIGISLALMAPSMAASISPQAAGAVGWAVPIAFALGFVGVLLVAYPFVRLTQRFHHSGWVYGFVGAALGPRPGVIAGWALSGTYLFYAVTTAVAGGRFLAGFFDATGIWKTSATLAPIPARRRRAGGGVVVGDVPAKGATRVLLGAEAVTVALIVVVIVVVFIKLASHSGAGGLVGFGTSANGVAAFVNSPSLIGQLGTQYVWSWIGNIISLGAMVSAFSCALASTVGAARLVYALARDGILHGQLSQVTLARGTPAASSTAVVLGTYLIIGFSWFGRVSPFRLFEEAATIGPLILLLVYILATIGMAKLVFFPAGSQAALPALSATSAQLSTSCASTTTPSLWRHSQHKQPVRPTGPTRVLPRGTPGDGPPIRAIHPVTCSPSTAAC